MSLRSTPFCSRGDAGVLMGPDLRVSESVRRSFEERLRSVAYASMAYWYYEWDWGEAIAYDGLDAVSGLLPESVFDEFVLAGVKRWGEAHSKTGVASRMGPLHCAARRLGGAQGLERLRPALEAFVADVTGAKWSAAGAILLDHGVPVVFVDSLYGEPPALADLAGALERPELIPLAVQVCLGHMRSLQDEDSGLFRHYCDTESGESPGILWGRGNGWALLGIADLLTIIGDRSVDGVHEVRERFERACDALVSSEVAGGGWRNIMTDEASMPEASTAALITAALLTAVHNGVLARDRFLPLAGRAWLSIEHRIDANGHLMGVSFRPGLNKDPARYEHVPLTGSYPWGQGAFLRAARAWHDEIESSSPAAASGASGR